MIDIPLKPEQSNEHEASHKFILHLQVQYISAEHDFSVEKHRKAIRAWHALESTRPPRLTLCSCAVSVLLRGVHAYTQLLSDKTMCNVWHDVSCHAAT